MRIKQHLRRYPHKQNNVQIVDYEALEKIFLAKKPGEKRQNQTKKEAKVPETISDVENAIEVMSYA